MSSKTRLDRLPRRRSGARLSPKSVHQSASQPPGRGALPRSFARPTSSSTQWNDDAAAARSNAPRSSSASSSAVTRTSTASPKRYAQVGGERADPARSRRADRRRARAAAASPGRCRGRPRARSSRPAGRSAPAGSRRPRPRGRAARRRRSRDPSRRSAGRPTCRCAASTQSQGGGLCTQRPPTIVATTSTVSSSSGGHSTGSRERTTRSARYPGTSLPRLRSSPASQAGATVVACSASSTVSASSHPPAGALVDRARDRRADPRERVELLDRRVGAVRDHRARLAERAERVRALEPVGPEALGEVAVRGRVRELHRACDAELREAAEILRREALRVLDPVPEPARRPLVPRRLERVERLAVRAVADRVHGHGPARARARADDLGQLVAARDPHARSRRASTPSASRASRP